MAKPKADSKPKDPEAELLKKYSIIRAMLFQLRTGAKALNDALMQERAQAAIDGIMGKKDSHDAPRSF